MSDLLVNIDVDDLEKAIAFYSNALGLSLGRRLGPDIAELRGRTAPIYLTAHPAGSSPFPGSTSPRELGRHWTPVHLDFVVPELGPAVRRAEAAGAILDGPIREFSWGRYAVLSDPFGNGFCLLEFVGRGYAELESQD